jgi:hypothetical protein
MTFKFNNEIFLSVKNIRIWKFCKKLTNRYLNFFRIFEKINNDVYKLELLNQYKRLNDSFYMNFLKFYVRKTDEKLPDFILIDEDNRFLLNYLLDKRISKGRIKYLIK